MQISKITYVDSFLPEKKLTNDDLSKIVDTNDEWIVARTGIKVRHIASNEETSSYMATESVLKLIKKSSILPEEIDGIIVATTTPDMSFPSVACIVQGKINAVNAFAFDVSAACSGFIYALSLADKIIMSGEAKKIIVVGVDKMSSLIDWSDRSTCILFGDGAGAVLVECSEEAQYNPQSSRIVSSLLHSDGRDVNILYTSGGVSTTQSSGFVVMKGQEVFKKAVIAMSDSTAKLLKKSNIKIEDIDLFVPHQANKRILDALARTMKVDSSKIMSSVEIYGNTSAASIPLALSLALEQGKIKTGDNIVLQSIGAGLTWASCLIKW